MIIPENLLVLDLETSGLKPDVHGILEIGACKLATGEEFACEVRLDDDKVYDPGVYRVNGITEEHARSSDRMTLQAGLSEFLLWLCKDTTAQKWITAGSNPEFDKRFLEFAMGGEERTKETFIRQTVALQGAAMALFIVEGIPVFGSLSADAIYKALGLSKEPNPHTAIQGVRYEAHAFHTIFNRLALRGTTQSALFGINGLPVDFSGEGGA